MAFTPLMVNLIEQLRKDDPTCRSVYEFGTQRWMTNDDRYKSTKEFYLRSGFESYCAIDINSDADLIADLNEPINAEPKDLVTNNGDGEHIFDQRSVFHNAHLLSKKWMIHVLPMTTWYNHGFYNYNPILFRDIAIANHYDMDISLSDRWGNRRYLPPDQMFKNKHMVELANAVAEVSEHPPYLVSIVSIFKKTKDTPIIFNLPFQGNYAKDLANDALRTRYQAQD